MRLATLPLLLLAPLALFAQGRIAFIKFFGYQGIDVQALRQALPFREGDVLRPEKIANEARSTVRRVTGRSATDINIVCCVGRGDSTVFIGLPGASSHPIPFDPAPQGVANPPAELIRLSEQLQRAEMKALRNSSVEDGAVGYRLLKDSAARAAEIAFHEYAAAHEAEILSVLTESGDSAQRAMAAEALGFGGRTPRQLAALARAVRDPDDVVRNNATRAIVEIVRADPSGAAQIPPDNFIQMLGSGTWTDRNKGSAVLMYLTQSRDPVLLRRIQSEAGDALLEMAAWHPLGQAIPALMILARIAGRSDGWAMLEGLPLSQIGQGAALAAFVSGLLAFAFARRTSKGSRWAFALLTPVLISTLLYWVLLRFVGLDIAAGSDEAFVFMLPWYLAATVAACATVMLRWSRPVHR